MAKKTQQTSHTRAQHAANVNSREEKGVGNLLAKSIQITQ